MPRMWLQPTCKSEGNYTWIYAVQLWLLFVIAPGLLVVYSLQPWTSKCPAAPPALCEAVQSVRTKQAHARRAKPPPPNQPPARHAKRLIAKHDKLLSPCLLEFDSSLGHPAAQGIFRCTCSMLQVSVENLRAFQEMPCGRLSPHPGFEESTIWCQPFLLSIAQVRLPGCSNVA